MIIANDGEDVEELVFPSIAGGSGKWHSYSGKQFGMVLSNQTCNCHSTSKLN